MWVELRIIKEEEIMGDPRDISDFFLNLAETWKERGYSGLTLDRYYGNEAGYLVLTGIKSDDPDSDLYDDAWGFSEVDD